MPYCFDIGGTNIRFGMPEANGNVPVIASVATPTKSLAHFVEAIENLIQTHGKTRHNSIAISLTGVVHPKTQKVRVANIPAIDGVNISHEITKRLGLPTVVANDADCLALAEARVGVAKGAKNVFAIVLGTGVGGGVVADGHIVAGSNGAAGEWGHGPVVDPTAGGKIPSVGYFECGCGQVGCLDTVGGARGMEKLHKALCGKTLKSEEISAAWIMGEPDACTTIDIWSQILSGPLAMIVNLLGPEIVPVGGGLANAVELISLLDAKVRERVLFPTDQALVVPATFAKSAGLVGAAQLDVASFKGVA
ncbi:ROK family protein [Maritalea porphyrae]|uniref:ROK family protein n=1 Tax=Maritalea porphyrae TaxID=880732 RepID=UPI0022AF3006|nr:ROK family protein [Maritalea porphyrae]MCZ4271536.1 ROK family protein [Maritalea porphyrae]